MSSFNSQRTKIGRQDRMLARQRRDTSVSKATAYLATVHLLVDAQTAAQAEDAISALLTERGLYAPGSTLLDWSYRSRGERVLQPRPMRYNPDLKPLLLSLARLRHPRKGGAE